MFTAVIEAHLCSPKPPVVLPLAPPASGAGTLPGGAPLPGPPSLSGPPAPVRPFAPLAAGGVGAAASGDGSAAPAAFAEWGVQPGGGPVEGIIDWSTVERGGGDGAFRSSPSPAEGGAGASLAATCARLRFYAPASQCCCMCK